MNRILATVAAAACVSFVSTSAIAGECNGVNSRMAETPIAVIKTEDGTTASLIRSTGASTTLAPAERAGTNWQHCVGIWTVHADETASGFGNCYSVSPAGDQIYYTWEFKDGKGTWKQIGGTGAFADTSDSGTWEPATTMGGTLGIGAWKGTCS